VTIKDHTYFADMGDLGALEFHTFSPEEKDISKPEWDKKRFGMVCSSTDVFSENKANILKLCYDNPRCTVEQAQALENFFTKIEGLP